MICSACLFERKTVQYLVPGVEGKCCGSCRRKWKRQTNPSYAKAADERHRRDAREFRRRHPDRVKNVRLRFAYGIDLSKYQELSVSQQGVCAICKIECKLFVDHDHATGKIRGLLCNACNLLLGKAKDSVEVLTSAVLYLKAAQ
jgi:hypothetical protein